MKARELRKLVAKRMADLPAAPRRRRQMLVVKLASKGAGVRYPLRESGAAPFAGGRERRVVTCNDDAGCAVDVC